MKSWLDNITDEQIKQFIQTKQQFDRIKISRNGNIIKVITTQISHSDEYDDVENTFYFNAYGAGYMYKGDLILHPLSEQSSKWFELVYKANIDTQIEGLTYCEAFEQAHENAILDINSIKNMLIQKQIDELTAKKEASDTQLKKDLDALHNSVNKMRKGKSEIKLNLIVENFLSRMSRQERFEWLRDNGYIQNQKLDEVSTSMVLAK